MSGVSNQLHGRVVHEHILVLNVRILLCQTVHGFAPETGAFQHVRLVHAGDLFTPLQCGLEPDAADALDFQLGIPLGVEGFRAVCARASAALAKVDAAGELAHHQEI
ncbi:hypothetical protein SDC9_145534 [bioreactor metagenome]|uniref:Uncharacterized protein n=1 Tax=bioreactor metagenome TaxID=1076179 RepID=A0A645EAD6_9ZZZZ